MIYRRVLDQIEDRILPSIRATTDSAARFRAVRRQTHRSRELDDALFAGTAEAIDAGVATRNITGF